MGGSNSSQLDETTSSHIREHTEAELKGFRPHLRRQYCVALCSKLQEELEQQNTSPALLLKQREEAYEVLYEGSVSQCEDGKKWKDKWAVLRDHSLELHDNQEMCKKGTPARQKLVLVGGTVVTLREKYEALVNKAIPGLSNGQEDSAPELVPPTAFPVYLRLPYRRDVYLCCHDNEQRRQFLSTLSHGIRHQNHDCLHKPTCEIQAFLAAVHFHRQEKGHYESWDMLMGDDTQVLTHLVMEGLIPFLQKELLPQLKGKRAEKRRTWLALVEAAHSQVLVQVQEALQTLKEECSTAAQQQGVVLRSNMDQIISSRAFLETKLQVMVSEEAQSVCAEHITPYLSSVLEELLEPVNGGFQAVRQLCEEQLERLCRDVRQGWTFQQVQQALQQASKAELEESFHRLEVLHEKLQELQQRFSYTNTTKLVQGAQRHMQQLMDSAMYTFESLLQSAVKDNPVQLGSVMEKAKLRVLKQYDYDSSTVRKQFFQEALMDITLPVLRRHLGPSCRPELERFEQYIFADCTDFINVENVYEDLLKKTLTPEVNKVVKEAASQKKHNLFVDSADLQAISQGSLSGSRTPPPRSPPPSSPSKQVGTTHLQPELKPSPLASSTGELEEKKEDTVGQLDQSEKLVEEVKEEKEKEQEQAKEEEEQSKQQEEQVMEQDSVIQVVSPPSELKEEVPDEPLSSPDALPSLIEPDPVTADSTTVRTDRAVYLNPPTGVPSGSAVPLSEGDSTLTLAPVAEDSSVPPGSSRDEPMTTTVTTTPAPPVTALPGEEGSVEEPEGGGGGGGDPEGTGEGQGASEEDSTSTELVSSEPTAGGATAPLSGTTSDGQKGEKEDEEQPLDCVKAIRDLVVEVIEVEDVIRPCPDGKST